MADVVIVLVRLVSVCGIELDELVDDYREEYQLKTRQKKAKISVDLHVDDLKNGSGNNSGLHLSTAGEEAPLVAPVCKDNGSVASDENSDMFVWRPLTLKTNYRDFSEEHHVIVVLLPSDVGNSKSRGVQLDLVDRTLSVSIAWPSWIVDFGFLTNVKAAKKAIARDKWSRMSISPDLGIDPVFVAKNQFDENWSLMEEAIHEEIDSMGLPAKFSKPGAVAYIELDADVLPIQDEDWHVVRDYGGGCLLFVELHKKLH